MGKWFSLFALFALLLGDLSPVSGTRLPAVDPPWQSKVDPWVLSTAASRPTEFLVYLTVQADLRNAAKLPTRLEKGRYVFQRLVEVARRTQRPLLAALSARGVEFRSYWVANMVWVRGDLALVQAMAQRADVARLVANPSVRLPEPLLQSPFPGDAPGVGAPPPPEWNILKVNADDVWAAGYRGQGAVVGGQDTGYDWDHPALKNQYRGWNGSFADHNYNWHDAIHQQDPHTSNPNPCGYNLLEPCADISHGTHTMGTMVGDDGASNQIGMAPAARWIGCRNMEQGWGTPASYSECYQWFIAPTDLNNQNPRPDLAPDVINNSWACPTTEGCTEPDILRAVVENVRAAGIVTVHSAGNEGPECNTVQNPPGIYAASFTVGASTSSDDMASFSSRGPVTKDGSNRLKPDITAPGYGVRSSVPGTGYGTSSGTSMAAPHVAGLVALLISAQPALAGQVDVIENLIEQTAVPLVTDQSCGGVSGDTIPNNTFGWGRIDALAAMQNVPHSFRLTKAASPASVFPGELLTYTLQITHLHSISVTHNVVLADTIPAGTLFLSATPPYTLVGDVIQWDFPALDANAAQAVELVVQALLPGPGRIVNDRYGVRSDEVPLLAGPPLAIRVGYPFYLPLLFWNPR